ncbi:MAG: hypothetical protein P8186_12430 [Anaerolineae bacterium]|jgi:hypothetical protein
MLHVGRWIGLLASAGTIGFWVIFIFLNPYSTQATTRESLAIISLMVGLALLGIVAAWKTKPYLMLAVFAVSFIPVGFYVLGTPGIFRWIGIFNVLFFASSLLMLGDRKLCNT